jgi:hypothetical protein
LIEHMPWSQNLMVFIIIDPVEINILGYPLWLKNNYNIYIYVNIVYPCYNCGWLLFPMIKPLILPICDGEPRFFTQT